VGDKGFGFGYKRGEWRYLVRVVGKVIVQGRREWGSVYAES